MKIIVVTFLSRPVSCLRFLAGGVGYMYIMCRVCRSESENGSYTWHHFHYAHTNTQVVLPYSHWEQH